MLNPLYYKGLRCPLTVPSFSNYNGLSSKFKGVSQWASMAVVRSKALRKLAVTKTLTSHCRRPSKNALRSTCRTKNVLAHGVCRKHLTNGWRGGAIDGSPVFSILWITASVAAKHSTIIHKIMINTVRAIITIQLAKSFMPDFHNQFFYHIVSFYLSFVLTIAAIAKPNTAPTTKPRMKYIMVSL